MDEHLADQLVRWTARAAMGGYALSLALGLLRRPRASVAAYVAGWAIYVVHVACALALVHGWSHAAAYEHTARRTEETIGIAWGGGLWFNYLFTALWTIDVVWRLAAPQSYARRPIALAIAIHAFLLFMAFNAVVVFGPPATRVVGIAVIVVLAAFVALPPPRGEPTSQRLL